MSDVIMLATARIDNPYSSTAVSLAKEFAKENRVFFVENPFTIKDVISKKKKFSAKPKLFSKGNYATEVVPNFWKVTSPPVLSINWLPEGIIYNSLSRVNERIFFTVIKKLLNDFNIRKFILFNVFNPFFGLNFPNWFCPDLSIYYSVDSISNAKYFSKHGVPKENKMLKTYDVVLATSKPIYEKIKLINSNAFYLPNGADYNLFRKELDIKKIPADLQLISEPRAIYIGNIDSRIDIELIEQLLVEKPFINIVFLGPVNSKGFSRLKNYENLFTLGSKKIEELPSYLKFCQCAIIPFVRNGFTRSIYPLKINEYLASGMPTVTTDFSDSMIEFEEIISVCSSHKTFISSVEEGVKDDVDSLKTERIKYASNNSWESRTKQFWNIINSSSNQNNKN